MIDLITVAYNNEKVIEHQIRLLRKNILDQHYYTVADNSPDLSKRQKIMQTCVKYNVPYIGLPRNPYNGKSSSSSHGLSLNWLFRHYISLRKAPFFGFIDHDIFPIYPTTIINTLDASCAYGLIQERNSLWYLWAGFSFFKYDYIKDKRVNFMPSGGLDTGGANWKSIYANLDRNKMPQLTQTYGRLREGDDPQSDWVEYIGDWLHTFNASNWKKAKSGKDDLVDQILNKY